jgi:DNA-directed RNA polymerase subunit M
MARKRKKRRRISRKSRKPKIVSRPQAEKGRGKIEFCKKCGSIMVPEKKRTAVSLKCRRCGYQMSKAPKELRISEQQKHVKGVVILEKDITMLPLTDQECEKCGHPKAYYWLQQTRSADEPPTQFFRCAKCKSVWREYK